VLESNGKINSVAGITTRASRTKWMLIGSLSVAPNQQARGIVWWMTMGD
jgi:hypothetical protein